MRGRGVDVEEGALLDGGQQQGARHQKRAGDRGELVGMSEGELAQEDHQRRWRIHFVEHPWCATRTQHVDVVDTLRAAGYVRDIRRQLTDRVDRTRGHPGAGQIHISAINFYLGIHQHPQRRRQTLRVDSNRGVHHRQSRTWPNRLPKIN